jgi:hypothetical protein
MAARLCALLSVSLLACATDRNGPTAEDEPAFSGEESVLRAPSLAQGIALHTYDGSNQTVHPDFVAPTAPWRRRQFYLAATPYPAGRSEHENPMLYLGHDGVDWLPVPGAPAPLALPKIGHLSDPDVVYDAGRNELVLYYREAADLDRIYVMRSRNGSAWTTPVLAVSGKESAVLSPAIVRRGSNSWLMWSVNADGGCRGDKAKVELRRSADGLVWTAPEAVELPLAPGRSAWHIDVQWIPSRSEYWALFPVKTPGGCATTALQAATSPDGVHWSVVDEPVLNAGEIPELSTIVYRSTFSFNAANDEITFWFSGAQWDRTVLSWGAAVQRRMRGDVFAPASGRATRIRHASRLVSAQFDPP